MQLVLSRDIRVEMIDGSAIVLDRSGAVVHHVSGDAAEALDLVRNGIDEADVPQHLAPAMASLVDAGVVGASDWSRRKLLKGAGVSLAGAALVTVALASPAAAASGTISGVPLVKSLNGANDPDPPLLTLCSTGGLGNSGRGTCTFTRTETPATISVTITLSTGTSAVGRSVYILQSTSSGSCVEGTSTQVDSWAASPAKGPQTFTTEIAPLATRFIISLQLSGGGGVDGWSSYPVNLA